MKENQKEFTTTPVEEHYRAMALKRAYRVVRARRKEKRESSHQATLDFQLWRTRTLARLVRRGMNPILETHVSNMADAGWMPARPTAHG